MFEKLLKQWADDQGFQGFAQDHAAVLRNLAKWLNQNATKQVPIHEKSLAIYGVVIVDDPGDPPIG